MYISDDDFDILKVKVANKDQFAITDLYNIYYPYMVSIFSKRFGFVWDDRQQCIDVAFTYILLKEPISELAQTDFQKYLYKWCMTIGRDHYLMSHARYKSKFNKTIKKWSYNSTGSGNTEDYLNNIPSYYSLEYEVIKKEYLYEVMKVVQSFHNKKAILCFTLMFVEDYTGEEIIRNTNLSITTIHTYCQQIRKFLKKLNFKHDGYLDKQFSIKQSEIDMLTKEYDVERLKQGKKRTAKCRNKKKQKKNKKN